MPTPKPLSPAELSALEHAFASDPTSEAYRPLAEAYLAAGRFMEAMVVGKKGVKAHPDDPAARVLLARVYAGQGKDRKALEEVSAVTAAFPTFGPANRLAGALHLRLGEKEPGEAALRRALEAAPDDPETRALAEKHGVSLAPPPAPPPVAGPPTAAPRLPDPSGPPVAPRVAPPAGSAPAAVPPAEPTYHAEKSEDVPLPTPVPSSRERGAAYAQALADKYSTETFHLQAGQPKPGGAGRHGTLVTTVALFVVLAGALGGWWYLSNARKERAQAIDRLLKEAREQVDRDTYPGYLEAGKRAAAVLELDDASLAGHAWLAYADAIRFAEHGDGDAARGSAVQHVTAGRRLGRHSHLFAAEAYLKAATGDPAGARDVLEPVVNNPEGGQVPFLLAVKGALHLRAGELDAARDALAKAQKAAPGDARTAWLLAEQYRRRGEGYDLQASGWYDYALRIQKDHLPSILGKALVLLDRGQLDEAGRGAAVALAPAAQASKPQLALARAIQAGVLAAQGKRDEATALEAEAVKLDPASPEIPWLVGVRKLREGDASGAVEAFQKAVALDNKRVSLYADLVRALLAGGGAPKAIDTLKRTVSRLGENPTLALLLGDAYRAAGDADLSRGQYEKAMQLGRPAPFPDARVALARLYREKGNIPGALVELTQAIEEYGPGGTGGASAAYVEMAEAERARGAKRELLAELYKKALDKDPASCDALWGAGKLDADGGRGEDARARFEVYAKVCPRGAHAAEVTRALGK